MLAIFIYGHRIPKIRMSKPRLTCLTAERHAQFKELFRAAARDGQPVDEGWAKHLMQLEVPELTEYLLNKIWVLSDTIQSGHLVFSKFALAFNLCELTHRTQKRRGL